MEPMDGQQVSCSDCNNTFVFTAAEQKFYEEKGLQYPPKRCKECRAQRKASRGSDGGGPPRERGGFGGRDGGRDSGRDGGRDSGREGGGSQPRYGAPNDRPAYGNEAPRFQGPRGYGGGAPQAAPRASFDDRGQRPSYGDRPARPSYGDRPAGPSYGDRGQRPSYGDRPARPAYGERPAYGAAPQGDRGQRPMAGGDRAPRAFRPQGQGDRFAPRAEGFRPQGPDDRPPPRERKPSPRFDVTCQKCGAAATVPFKPIEGREIFCPTCYRARKGIAEGAPRGDRGRE